MAKDDYQEKGGKKQAKTEFHLLIYRYGNAEPPKELYFRIN